MYRRYSPLVLTLLFTLTLLAVPAWAQTAPAGAITAPVQVIHNAADPAAAVVDIYLEEASTTLPLINDLAFRSATPFLNLASDTPLTIVVAPGDSDSVADSLAAFPVMLDGTKTYQLIANGVLEPDDFEDNPDGRSIAFTLLVNDAAQQESTVPEEVQFNVVHGSTDAPTIDVVARGVGTLVDDAAYTDITGYIGVAPDVYTLDVTTADQSAIVASFEADLSEAGGGALTVLASGFLTPDNDQNGSAFGLLVVFADGSSALLPAVSFARAQIIHNAADPAAAVVDIYIEEISADEPAVADLPFRNATAFIDLPAGEPLTIAVAPGDSDGIADSLASFPTTLVNGGTYSIIANGVLDPAEFEDNPSGRPIAFTLFIDDDAQEASTDPEEVQFSVVHGATDAPTIDVVARDVTTLVDDATYSDITPYIGVAPAVYILDVTTADQSAVVASFEADLSEAGGDALKILASGFLTPDNDQNGPAFGLLAVFADGSASLLPTAPVSNEGGASATAFALRGPFPNPSAGATAITFDLGADAAVGLEVFDVLGRRVAEVAPAPVAAGAERTVALQASLPSGTYVYRLTAEAAGETLTATGRLTVVR